MALNQNQFAQTPILGQLDLDGGPENVISCLVDHAQATPLVPGGFVKLATTAGGPPHVLGVAADTDQSFGVCVYNLKDSSYPADSRVEVALFGSIIFLNSGEAITRGNSVEMVAATPGNVLVSDGVNPVVGFALDGATGANQLIRVYIQAPFAAVNSALTNRTQTLVVTATLAEINAGKVLIPGVAGQAITVSNIINRVVGTFATGTSVELESTNGTPVAVMTYAETAIAGTTVLLPGAANTTIGAGFGVPLGTADGLKVVNNGSAQTGGTSMEFTITFTQA